MKTVKELKQDLSDKTIKHLGYDLSRQKQGSPEWLKARLGVITASEIHNILSDGRGGKTSAKWDSYMLKLLAEIVTGESPELTGKALEWGSMYEPEARDEFCFDTGLEMEEITFIFSDCMRYGASPDAINDTSGLEIKCPYNSANHIKFLLDDAEINKEYLAQIQYTMFVTERPEWYFASYDTRAKKSAIKYLVIKQDPETQDKLAERLPLFIGQMDEKLETIGFEWGDQWKL